MKYCQQCGKQIDDDSTFCTGCGKQTNEQRVATANYIHGSNSYDYHMEERQNSLNVLGKMYEYFNPKRALYNEYDDLQMRIANLQKRPSSGLLVFGIILEYLGVCIGLQIGSVLMENHPFVGTVFSLVIIGVFSIPLAIYILTKSSNKRKVKAYGERLCVVANALTQHFNAFGFCPIGAEYTNPAILEVLAHALQSGRADSIKEALNVLLTDAHRSAVEFSAMQAANSARSAAAGATASAIFSAASFFIR